jgi:hypothetical protein
MAVQGPDKHTLERRIPNPTHHGTLACQLPYDITQHRALRRCRHTMVLAKKLALGGKVVTRPGAAVAVPQVPPVYLFHQICVVFARWIFFCSCRMPYRRPSDVGGHPGT